MQFYSKDKKLIVQIGPTGLTVNHLKPYTQWENFEPVIHRMLAIFVELLPIKRITRLGLRYINQIEINNAAVSPGEFFSFLPSIPDGLPPQVNNYVVRAEIPYENRNAVLVMTSATVKNSKPLPLKFILDIDFTTGANKNFSVEQSHQWLRGVKEEINNVFEACLTAETKKMFGGVKNG